MSVKNGINGWAGTVLRVNLSTGAITKEDTLPKYKPYIGGICHFFHDKGESAGQKLSSSRFGRFGLMAALIVFVGIPIPGTGAWTGTLGASFLDLGMKKTALSVTLGVLMAAIIMATVSNVGFHAIGM